jgi:iron complex outermembrane receptor protein
LKNLTTKCYSAIRLFCVVLVLVGGTHSVRAQSAGPDQSSREAATSLEEIVVTARKTQERLIDVPVAVTALTQDAIERYNATDLTAIGNLIPGVTLYRTGGGTNGANLSIRGVGALGADFGSEQPVAVNIDGVQITRGHVIDIGLFDLNSAEVLKGPQALFFGKNSPAGVVSLYSVSPGSEFDGYVRVADEFLTRTPQVEGAVTIPITGTLSVRVAGRYSDMSGGYVKNVARPIADPFPGDGVVTDPGAAHSRGPGTRTEVIRATVDWKPNDSFEATLRSLHANYRDRDVAEVVNCARGEQHPSVINELNPAQVVQDPYGPCTDGSVQSDGSAPAQMMAHYWGGFGNGALFDKSTSDLEILTLRYGFGHLNVTSVTGYYYASESAFNNFSATVYPLGIEGQINDAGQFSQEIRAVSAFDGPVNFTVGGYYEHANSYVVSSARILPFPAYPGPGPYNGDYNNFTVTANNTGRSYSGFGQLNWRILSNLEFAAGARWSHEEKNTNIGNTFNYFDLLVAGGAIPAARNPFSPAGIRYNPRFKENNTSPEATLTWYPRHNLTVYGAFKTGYLAGGAANPGDLSNYSGLKDPNAPLEYGQETVKGVELGIKGEWFDRRLSGDLTLYDYKYTGLQVQTLDIQTSAFEIHNAGSSRSEGIEAQVNLRFNPYLSAHGSVEFTELKFLSYPHALCYPGQAVSVPSQCPDGTQNLSGHRYGGPPQSGNIGLIYEHAITPKLSIAFTGDVYAYAKAELLFAEPGSAAPAYTFVNVSARLYDAARWTVACIGTNIFDATNYSVFSDKALGLPGDIIGFAGTPRGVVLQGTYQF